MIKNKTFIEIELKGRDYIFICSPDSPLQEAYDALKLIDQYLVDRLKVLQEQPQLEDKKEDSDVD